MTDFAGAGVQGHLVMWSCGSRMSNGHTIVKQPFLCPLARLSTSCTSVHVLPAKWDDDLKAKNSQESRKESSRGLSLDD